MNIKNTVRITAALLVSAMLLSAAACDNDKKDTPAASDTVTAAADEITAAAETEPEETEPEITEPPVIKADGIDVTVFGNGDPVEGETRKMDVVIIPEDASDKSYSVAFSDDKIAETDENGDLHFIAPGSVKITVTSVDGPEAVLNFTVKPAVTDAESVSLSKSSLELEVGKSEKITAAVSPDATTDKSVKWNSSDSSVASVSDGNITAIKAGKAVITVSTVNGKTASCDVAVKDPEIPVTDIQMECLALTMNPGQSHKFSLALVPSNTTMNTVTVVSSDASVVSVSGLTFTANKIGTAVITVTSKNGISKQCTVTVKEAVVAPPQQTQPVQPAQEPSKTNTAPAQPPVEEDMSLPQADFPRVSGRVSCADNKYWCISGTTSVGSTVHANITIIAKDGSKSVKNMDVTPQGTRFFFMFRLNRDQNAYVELTATAPGKRTSKASSTSIKYSEKSTGNNTGVSIGENSWLHLSATADDFKGTNLFSDSDLNAIKKVVFKTLEELRKRSGRDDIKAIFLIAPNNATIYPENAPTEWKEKKKSDNSRLKQVIASSKTWNEKDITFIDLYEYLVSQKSIGHIYYQTDTHWNKVGAYFGYYKLMNAIAVDFPEAKPHEFSEFTMSEITYTGDMSAWLGFGPSAGSETTLNLTPNFPTAVTSRTGGDYGTNGVITTTVANDKLPTAVVQRDSFGTALHSFLAEHFSKLVYTTFGADRGEAYKVCEEISPDYFIRIMVERDLYGKILN